MDQLVEQMKVVLASTFAYYLKAHGFHWNVTGVEFPQYHAFFETIYTDAWEAVDGLAERVRTLDSFAPASLSRYQQLSIINDQLNIPVAAKMVKELELDNNALKQKITATQALAEKAGEMGLANFLQDRIDIHAKFGWMLKSITKS